jgi:outer membrane protein OmpA-like peptidoglycan-associated protein
VPTTDVVQFDQGKSRVTNVAKAKLDDIALRLRENPRATVEIIGYPDSTRGARGEKLAQARALHLKQYLIDRHGIDGARIRTRSDIEGAAGHEGQAVLVTTSPRP